MIGEKKDTRADNADRARARAPSIEHRTRTARSQNRARGRTIPHHALLDRRGPRPSVLTATEHCTTVSS